MFKTVAEIKRANERSGRFFFQRETLSFFDSRIIARVVAGRYFVTSEQAPAGIGGYRQPRLFTVRKAAADGQVSTVGEFQAYQTEGDAFASIADLLAAR